MASLFAQMFGGWEVVLIVAVVIVLLGARHLPGFGRGLGEGLLRFRKEIEEIDQEALDAGKSLGGIYGKPAAQALTPGNQTAELYDPAALHDEKDTGPAAKRRRFRGWRRLWRLIWRSVLKRLS